MEPTCRVLRARDPEGGATGFDYQAGVSAETVGATGICLQVLTIPPGGKARAHRHDGHETAISIPAGMPHLPHNTSESEPAVALIARTDPSEQESVVLLPELDDAG
jgi:uncharacterized RmlC-like cupin family protein